MELVLKEHSLSTAQESAKLKLLERVKLEELSYIILQIDKARLQRFKKREKLQKQT
jgi:hypothetical protein